ncbi:adenylate cyclase [Rhizocola hellebori]|uniref:Adenylate cyclase n=1 Tax=Rhizocola hellebori TaxID=1392758 RepID=A0A8J3VHZ6_9ACTN|nr:CYTH domain-containing protein [Rhizocola hellebori]GIH07045.1 adenylate cyclase [Rhizocola hellebori]
MSGNVEIERKFLVASSDWRDEVSQADPIRQAYVAVTDKLNVRVRRYGPDAFLTVKGKAVGITRKEIETAVPVEFVEAVLAEGLFQGQPVEKTRYLVPHKGFTFEIDVFEGANAGLVVAEIELESEESDFPRPPWLGEEVTADHRYSNSYLAQHSWSEWGPPVEPPGGQVGGQ